MKDWRRINVSFTRAKSKLVIFGSKRTLEGDPLLKGFIELMGGKGWIYRLHKGADGLHGDEQCVKEEKRVDDGGMKNEPGPKGAKGRGRMAGMLGSKPFAKDILAVSTHIRCGSWHS